MRCDRIPKSPYYKPCSRDEQHEGPCAHEERKYVYIVSRLNQWGYQGIVALTASKTDAESVFNNWLEILNQEWRPGWVEYGDDYGPPRLQEDWEYFEVSPKCWKNKKGHFVELNKYEV